MTVMNNSQKTVEQHTVDLALEKWTRAIEKDQETPKFLFQNSIDAIDEDAGQNKVESHRLHAIKAKRRNVVILLF